MNKIELSKSLSSNKILATKSLAKSEFMQKISLREEINNKFAERLILV